MGRGFVHLRVGREASVIVLACGDKKTEFLCLLCLFCYDRARGFSNLCSTAGYIPRFSSRGKRFLKSKISIMRNLSDVFSGISVRAFLWSVVTTFLLSCGGAVPLFGQQGSTTLDVGKGKDSRSKAEKLLSSSNANVFSDFSTVAFEITEIKKSEFGGFTFSLVPHFWKINFPPATYTFDLSSSRGNVYMRIFECSDNPTSANSLADGDENTDIEYTVLPGTPKCLRLNPQSTGRSVGTIALTVTQSAISAEPVLGWRAMEGVSQTRWTWVLSP